VDTVPAKLAAQIHNEVAESVGITKKDLAKALAMGGPRAEYAIPVQLADALDAFNSPVPENRLGATLKAITGKWKQWQLVSPRRVIKYNLRNLSGDADAVFVGNPDTFRFVPDAITDLRPVFFSPKAPEGELREFFQRGGFETALRAQEIHDLKDVEILSRLFELKDKTIAEKGILEFKKAWNKMALATDFRETIRYRYRDRSERVDKKTTFFVARATSLKTKGEEGVLFKWFHPHKALEIIMFEEVKEVLLEALKVAR